MLQRIKQAALVLAGHRPAEVRLDEDDLDIAREIAQFWATLLAECHPEFASAHPGKVMDVRWMFFTALSDYATWHREGKTRYRRKTVERQMEIPF